MRALGIGQGCALAPPTRSGPQIDVSAGALPPGAALSRGGGASVVRRDGGVAFVGADAARFDHDPATGRRRGLLVEPARTNLLTRACVLTHPAWLPYRGAGVQGAAAAPDGGTGAGLVAFGTSGGAAIDDASAIYQSTGQAVAGARHVASIWVRAAGAATSVRLGFYPGGGRTIDSGDVAVGAAWTRLTVAGTALSANVHLSLRNNAAGTSLSVLAWGGQLEAGDEASSLIATDDAPATRAADQLRIDCARLGVPDGPARWRCWRERGATDVAGTVAGGRWSVPTDTAPLVAVRLARRGEGA